MLGIFARLLAFWQGGEPQTATGTGLHFWRKARESAQRDAGENLIAERRRFWETGGTSTRGVAGHDRTTEDGFPRQSAEQMREDAQPRASLWQEKRDAQPGVSLWQKKGDAQPGASFWQKKEKAETTREMIFALPKTTMAQEVTSALPGKEEGQIEKAQARKNAGTAAETARENKTAPGKLFLARLWQGDKVSEGGERQKLFALPARETDTARIGQ